MKFIAVIILSLQAFAISASGLETKSTPKAAFAKHADLCVTRIDDYIDVYAYNLFRDSKLFLSSFEDMADAEEFIKLKQREGLCLAPFPTNETVSFEHSKPNDKICTTVAMKEKWAGTIYGSTYHAVHIRDTVSDETWYIKSADDLKEAQGIVNQLRRLDYCQ